MEELLATIPSTDIREYMREAMSCYMAGAYRGSVVLSYIALFDDLLLKLGELANVNSTAKTIYADAFKRRADQDVYETYLIDQLASKNLISGMDSSFLITLRTLRNKSAHPSGHKPSAEEARFIFFETINRFLSQPILSTTHLVDEIVARLKNSNFFPSVVIADIKTVVGDEIAALHVEATTQLVAKLTSAIVSVDSAVANNARLFLVGLANHDTEVIRAALQSRLVMAKADNSAYADLLTQVLSSNGKLFIGLNASCVSRIRSIVANKIADVTGATAESKLIHPTQALTSIAFAIGEADFASTFHAELQALFEKRAHSEFVAKLVCDKPSLLSQYLPALLGRAGSSDFNTANSFANSIESLDGVLSKLLTNEQALQLLVAVIKAANWGAWSAKGVTSAKFASAPLIRAKALAHIAAEKSAAAAYIKETLSDSKPIDDFVATHLVDAEAA